MDTYAYFVLFGVVQLIHSQEEIWTGFHRQWFVFTMPRALFIAFEIAFTIPILVYMLNPEAPGASVYMPWFMFVMLLNGMEHVVWAGVKKNYVPGLVTAPFFIILFVFYFASLI